MGGLGKAVGKWSLTAMPSIHRSSDGRDAPRRLVARRRDLARRSLAGHCIVIEELESRRCPSVAPGLAAAAIDLPSDPNSTVAGQLLGVGSTELYHVSVGDDGLLVAQVDALGFDTRLSLLDGQGNMLIQSEASSPQDPNDRVAVHVTVGDYFLMVQDETGSGSFTMETSFTIATAPSQPLGADYGSYSVAAAVLSGDGIPDVIVSGYYVEQVLVYMGVGDGTFQPPIAVSVGSNPVFVTTADLTGNGIQDIITANSGSNDVSVVLGNGDGTFQPAIEIPAGDSPTSVAVGDFNGDGHPDLAVTDSNGNDVKILIGRGDGTFAQGVAIHTGLDPASVVAGDFDGDGQIDLAVATTGSSQLAIFQGHGDGTFTPAQQFQTGPSPTSLIAADLDGDGQLDLAVACAGDNTVRVFQNQNGWFVPSTVLQTDSFPYSLIAADFNGDGRIDLAASSYGAGEISIFFNHGNGAFQPPDDVPTGAATGGIAAADLTGDGRTDLIATDLINLTVPVLLGNGDGTFQTPSQTSVPTSPESVVSADLTGNGIQDLIVVDHGTNDVSILLGRGDGTFRSPILIPVGLGAFGVTIGDFNGDGIPDLAVTNSIEDTVSILLGNGDGTFRLEEKLVAGVQPYYITSADLEGNGRTGLVVVNALSDTLSIFYGNGDGTFQNQVVLPAGSQPGDPVVADLNGGPWPDIAIPHTGSDVSIFFATGPRSYAPATSIWAGPGPSWIAVGDLTGNGIPDLVVSDSYAFDPSYVTVLLGNGDGTFHTGGTYPVGETPYPVVLGDFTGNGILDILTGNVGSNDLSMLLGRGDGTFLPAIELPSDPQSYDLAVGDFTGNGKLDIAAAGYQSDGVSILLNEGGGVFDAPVQIASGASQIAMVTADFNDDGRLDLAVANPMNETVTIMIGKGDGSFTIGQTLAVGGEPSGLVVGDFNGDGVPDLAVADAGSDDVEVYFGLGDGTFGDPITLAVGEAPHAIVAGDFLGNGITDIAVADELSDDVAVLIGRGDGTFLPARRYPVGVEPVALVAADFNGDGYTDLVTADRTSGDLTILWGLGGGNFSPQTVDYGGHAPSALAVGDFTGDGRLDLAVADEEEDEVVVLLGLGGGTFAAPVSFDVGEAPEFLEAFATPAYPTGLGLAAASSDSQDAVGLLIGPDGVLVRRMTIPLEAEPIGVVVGEFTSDGRPDVAFLSDSSSQVLVELGTGNLQVAAFELSAPFPQAAPIIVDWNDDGTPDVFGVDQKGQLLLRLGQPGSPGQFEPPQIIGQNLGVRFSDIALVNTRYGPVLAALEQDQPRIWLFSVAQGPGASIEARSITVTGASLLVSMAAGDLDQDGLDDLVLVDRGNDRLIVLYQNPDGTFSEHATPLDVGYAPSEAAIADLNSDDWPDLVVSNTYSGDLSVFYGGPGRQFSPEVLLPAGLGAAVLVSQDGNQVPHTDDDPIGVTTGVFDASGLTDVVSVQSGSDRISLLDGIPDGGLANPTLATSDSTGVNPTQVVAAALTKDGLTDLVVLNQGSQDISIFLNNGRGGFITMPAVNAGNDPTGIAVRDVNGDGIPDLLVSNGQGDLLIIIGNGDGTFQPYERADQAVSLAVGDFNSDGQPDFVLSDTSIDQLSIDYGETQSFVQGRSQGLEAPGAVAVADLNGDGNPDIIVVNQGENDILVYLGLGGNEFEAPLKFFTGTDPVGLTVADLTDTGVPDLIVANAGSNDLSVFIGVGRGADWELEPRPRLAVGDEPVSTTVADLDGDGIPDIIAVDRVSDNVVVLRGLGDGFFDDQDPLTLPAGPSPIRAFVGTFDDAPGLDLAVLDSASSDLTYYSDFLDGSPSAQYIPSGGPDPIAAVMGTSRSGYSTLFIAHQGDDAISVLLGSPDGLVMAPPVYLGSSVQPTDLVLSRDDSGSLRLYVSAAGADGVVLVSIKLGFGSAMASPVGDEVAPSSPIQGAATRESSPSSTASPFAVETISTGINAQVQTSSQTETTAVAPMSASAPAAGALGGLAVTLQQIISPTMAPLTFLVNNLAPVAYVQISDIMPMDNSVIETVAVLLVVPEASVESAGGCNPTRFDGAMSEAPRAVVNPRPDAPARSPRSSNLKRYLADLDGALDGVPQDVLAAVEMQGGAWPRRPGDMEFAAVAVTRADQAASDESVRKPERESDLDQESVARAEVVQSGLPVLDGGRSRTVPSDRSRTDLAGWARLLGGMLVISSALFGWRAARKWWPDRRSVDRLPTHPPLVGPHQRTLPKGSRSSRSRNTQRRRISGRTLRS